MEEEKKQYYEQVPNTEIETKTQPDEEKDSVEAEPVIPSVPPIPHPILVRQNDQPIATDSPQTGSSKKLSDEVYRQKYLKYKFKYLALQSKIKELDLMK